MQSFALHIFGTTSSVWEMGVATVNNNITWRKKRNKFLNEVVHCLTCLYHKEDLTGRLQRSYKLFQGMSTVDVLTCSTTIDEFVNLLYSSIKYTYMKALALHVKDEVLAHHGQSYQADV